MTRTTIVSGLMAMMFALLALAGGHWARGRDVVAAATSSSPTPADVAGDLLYGRVRTEGGALYEGRLRFGGDEEAFWDHYFNGVKDDNRWAAYVSGERVPKMRDSIGLFGREIVAWQRQIDLSRPFMARFGDIARIDARGRDLRVTLKSGTVFDLDRFAADDFADGLRVWDRTGRVVDLDEWRIRSVEFIATARFDTTPDRLHGTVHTRNGDFTGFIQWDRKESVGSDTLDGRSAAGRVSLRFDTIRSISRRSIESSVITLLDGREIVLSNAREVDSGNRGIYVDDCRYGRVLVASDAVERVDFSPGSNSPVYREFLPGRPLTGTVITRSGRQLAGRLVYDLDESETIETLDAPSEGVDYIIPFRFIASIARGHEHAAPHATVVLHTGEELQLESSGDLSETNAGMLIFVEGRERPEYVPWPDVKRIDLNGGPPVSASGRPAMRRTAAGQSAP